MAIAKMRKPTGKEAFEHLYNQGATNESPTGMMQGYCEGKWYLDGLVVTKGDWVALRLLYLMIALDTSNMQIAEVKNAYGFYVNKFGEYGVRKVFELLRKDPKSQKSFEKNPESRTIRAFHNTLKAGDEDSYEDITKSI